MVKRKGNRMDGKTQAIEWMGKHKRNQKDGETQKESYGRPCKHKGN